jgi:hypothetical protein
MMPMVVTAVVPMAISTMAAAPVIGMSPAETTAPVINLLDRAIGLHHIVHAGNSTCSHRVRGRSGPESECARQHHDESEHQLSHRFFSYFPRQKYPSQQHAMTTDNYGVCAVKMFQTGAHTRAVTRRSINSDTTNRCATHSPVPSI